jgi:hypothetical protein
MSHYAQVINGIVTQVIVAEQDFIDSLDDSNNWFQTSYNTYGNVHYGPDGQPDGKIPLRGNYAGIGYVYDSSNDVFYVLQPYPSWTLNNTTWLWEAPTSRPNDEKAYSWNESLKSWDLVA